jgi:WD40 repeat protein
MIKSVFFLLLAGISLSCYHTEKKPVENSSDYNWGSPSQVYKLPKELKEVSGIYYINSTAIACNQDEAGSVFLFNPGTKRIDKTFEFGEPGDYEDLTKVGEDYFILRSDGTIFKHSGSNTNSFKTNYDQCGDYESLCFDKDNNRLILGCKKGDKAFITFDLSSSTFNDKPLFKLQNKKLEPTAASIHPKTKELYVLCRDRILILSLDGTIKREHSLAGPLFPQPEGITFKENGDLLISNEAKKNSATILEFKYR